MNEMKKMHYENRIDMLTKREPVVNANIIRKLKRNLRNIQK